MNTSDVKAMGRFSDWMERISNFYDVLQPVQRNYLKSAAFFVLYLPLVPFEWEVKPAVLFLAFLFWGLAIGTDLANFYKRFVESVIGKLLLVVILGVGANASIAMATQVVNDIVGIDPAKFVHTVAFVTAFTASELVILVMSVLFIVGMILAVPYLIFSWIEGAHFFGVGNAQIPWPRLTATVRFVSFLALCGYAYSWFSDEKPEYRAFVKSSAEWFLYSLEMYEKAPCLLQEGERVAYLEGGQVLVATPSEKATTFELRSCAPGP